MAPLLVLGGKNSREKNLSLDSIRELILSIKEASELSKGRGESQREVDPGLSIESTSTVSMSKSRSIGQ